MVGLPDQNHTVTDAQLVLCASHWAELSEVLAQSLPSRGSQSYSSSTMILNWDAFASPPLQGAFGDICRQLLLSHIGVAGKGQG